MAVEVTGEVSPGRRIGRKGSWVARPVRAHRRRACNSVSESGSLVIENLAQGVQDFHQVGLVGHDLVDVLVGGGDLIHEGFGPLGQPHLAGHLGSQISGGEQLLGLGAAMPAARAVRAAVPAGRVALAGDDVAAGTHRAGDHAQVAAIGLDGSLSGDPHLPGRHESPAG